MGRGVIVAIGFGVVLMVVAVFGGNAIQADIGRTGVDGYTAQNGARGWIEFLLFAFGFPVGLGLAAVGAASAGGTTWGRLLVVISLASLTALAPIIVPLTFGRTPSPTFFSSGGYVILALAGTAMWLWARRRSRAQPEARLAMDFQGAGYACFGMAAWNLCGVGGMPSYALHPERALELGTAAFATGQMKAVMALLVLGWAFTAFSLWMSNRKGRRF